MDEPQSVEARETVGVLEKGPMAEGVPGVDGTAVNVPGGRAKTGKRARRGEDRPPEKEGRGAAFWAYRRGPRSPQWVGRACLGGVQYILSVWGHADYGGKSYLALMFDTEESAAAKKAAKAAAEGGVVPVGGVIPGAYAVPAGGVAESESKQEGGA